MEASIRSPDVGPENYILPNKTYITMPYTALIEMSCLTDGAKICFTLDGSNPTPDSDVYEQAFELRVSATVKAKDSRRVCARPKR